MKKALSAGAGLLLLAAPAAAEPTTYEGTLGKSAVVVEFTDDPATVSAPLAGRYFYRAQGVDIPLQPGKAGVLSFGEEEPCSAEQCPAGTPGPIGATWTLETENKGQTLSGTWVGGPKRLPLVLKRLGTRPSGDTPPKTPYDLQQASISITDGGSLAAMPYDVQRFATDKTRSGETTQDGGRFVYLTDPRTKFSYPRLVRLSDGASTETANEALGFRQDQDSLNGLIIASSQYAGFADPDTSWRTYSDGTLGGYEDMQVEVSALAGHLLSWTEAGSIDFGGAHPDNFISSFAMDISTGKLLEAKDLFRDWKDGQPGSSLARFARQRFEAAALLEAKDQDSECFSTEMIAQYLGGHFGRDAAGKLMLVFTLENAPHVMSACEGDFAALPFEDAKPLLKPHVVTLVEAVETR